MVCQALRTKRFLFRSLSSGIERPFIPSFTFGKKKKNPKRTEMFLCDTCLCGSLKVAFVNLYLRCEFEHVKMADEDNKNI